MKRILVLVVLIAAGVFAFKAWDKQQGERAARLRVEGVIRAMAEKDEQTAIGLWAENREKLDAAGLAAYQLGFERFWSESGLASASDWTVAAVDAEPNSSARLVTVRSGDQRVVLRVPRNATVSLIPRE